MECESSAELQRTAVPRDGPCVESFMWLKWIGLVASLCLGKLGASAEHRELNGLSCLLD